MYYQKNELLKIMIMLLKNEIPNVLIDIDGRWCSTSLCSRSVDEESNPHLSGGSIKLINNRICVLSLLKNILWVHNDLEIPYPSTACICKVYETEENFIEKKEFLI